MVSPSQWRIRTKLTVLILFLAAASVLLFVGLWHGQNNLATVFERMGIIDWFDEESFEKRARALAKDYTVPDYHETDENLDDPTVIAFQSYLDTLSDELTGVYVYGQDDGLFRGGTSGGIVQRSWFNTLWTLEFKMFGEEIVEFPVAFANGTYAVTVFSYHRVLFAYPYLLFCALVSLTVFFAGILLFVRRMTRRIHSVEDAILRMASGDLETPLPACGGDEIGVVARELDNLRTTLADNFQRTHDAQTARRDLITALSHDLRTPLTVLIGYLEVMLHQRDAAPNPYAARCLKKAEEMKILTNHLFDAALDDDAPAQPVLIELPLSSLHEAVRESIDYLCACGFTVDAQTDDAAGTLNGDAMMLERICDNLFSNIVKYGSKEEPVIVSLQRDGDVLRLQLHNKIKDETAVGHHIGLQNVRRMLAWHAGSLQVKEDAAHFTAILTLPLSS